MLELASVHFAKAGGTSLFVGLSAHYADALHVDHDHDPCNPNSDHLAPAVLPAGVRAIHGHFKASRYAALQPRRLITFLREPVDKLLSVYFFWKTLARCGHPVHDRFLEEQPDILEFARQTAGTAFPAYFGGTDMREFDFVGFHDRRPQDLKTLSALLGFTIPSDVRTNVTPLYPERQRIGSDPEIMASLKRILSDDIEFYLKIRTDRPGGFHVERNPASRQPRLEANR